MTTYEQLATCAGKDGWPGVDVPFLHEVNGEQWSCATDGYAFVAVRGVVDGVGFVPSLWDVTAFIREGQNGCAFYATALRGFVNPPMDTPVSVKKPRPVLIDGIRFDANLIARVLAVVDIGPDEPTIKHDLDLGFGRWLQVAGYGWRIVVVGDHGPAVKGEVLPSFVSAKTFPGMYKHR